MITAIIVAAGRGMRFAEAQRNKEIPPKQFLHLGGIPLYIHSVKALSVIPDVDSIIIVTAGDYICAVKEQVASFRLTKVVEIVAGGDERQDSVWNGLQMLPCDTEIVLVHDGARPFPPMEATRRAITLARTHGAAILAQPTTDTVKITPEGVSEGDPLLPIETTLTRTRVWRAQTPQVFQRHLILHAYEFIRERGLTITDEAQAVEVYGKKVFIVPSPGTNMKITTPRDLETAERML